MITGLASYYDVRGAAGAAWSYEDAWTEVRRICCRAFATQRLVAATAAVTAIAAIPWLIVSVLAVAIDIDVPLRNIARYSSGGDPPCG
jgi:hypothetical protein